MARKQWSDNDNALNTLTLPPYAWSHNQFLYTMSACHPLHSSLDKGLTAPFSNSQLPQSGVVFHWWCNEVNIWDSEWLEGKTIELLNISNTATDCLQFIQLKLMQSLTFSPDNVTTFSPSALRLCSPFTTANKLWTDRLSTASSKEVNLWQATMESTKGAREAGRWYAWGQSERIATCSGHARCMWHTIHEINSDCKHILHNTLHFLFKVEQSPWILIVHGVIRATHNTPLLPP